MLSSSIYRLLKASSIDSIFYFFLFAYLKQAQEILNRIFNNYLFSLALAKLQYYILPIVL